MAKAQAWCQKNKAHIGLYEHEAMMTDLAADVVNSVLVPDQKEMDLIALYDDRERMNLIADANRAAVSMLGPSRKVGAGWWVATAATGLVGAGLLLSGRQIAGGIAVGVAVAGGSLLGGLAVKQQVGAWWRNTWSLP
jgi:hypothetical protein